MARPASRGHLGVVGGGVFEELGPADRAACRGFDALGEGDGWFPDASDDPVNLVVGAKLKLSLQGSDGGDSASEVHAPRLTPKRGHATQNSIIPKIGATAHPQGMAKWIYHEAFHDEVKAYKDRTGKIQATIAEELDVDLSTLRNWCYGSKKPSDTAIIRAATLFGCSTAKFSDDPGREIAGQSVANLSEKRRFLAGLMFDGITSDELTDEDAQLLWEDHLAAKARILSLRERMRKQGGA